jgi:hypothetical protein
MKIARAFIPALSLAYCCAYSIVCIGMYLDHRRYQPIFYVADLLHVYAIASAWFFVEWDTIVSNLLCMILHGLFMVLALITLRNFDSFQNTYYDDSIPFPEVRQSTFGNNENIHSHNARVAVVWIALLGSVVQFGIVTLTTILKKEEEEPHFPKLSFTEVLLVGVLTLCVFCSILPYPRFSRVDSPHTTLLVGLVLAIRPSLAQTFVLLIGIVFSVLYTIGYMYDCSEGSCFATTFRNDRFVYRDPEWMKYIYEEVSTLCFASALSLILMALYVYFHNLFALRIAWISCLEKFNKTYRMC